jgi:hypothetical protein
MTRTFTQVPPDSTGDKLAMRSYVEGADTKHSQGVYFDGLPSFRLMVPAIVPAANKYHAVLFNQAASAQTLWLLGVYCINDNVTGVTGVINQFNFRRITSGSTPTLTAVTPLAFNSADPALANVIAGHTATANIADAANGIIAPFVVSSEEGTAVPTNTAMHLQHMANLLPPLHPYQRPLALRPNEGAAVKQIGAGTVGALSWIIDFAVEPD